MNKLTDGPTATRPVVVVIDGSGVLVNGQWFASIAAAREEMDRMENQRQGKTRG